MYDQQLLKEKYGFSTDTYGDGWINYLKAKVKLIRKNGLEAIKMDYNGYKIYDIYSFKGDCKFDVVMLSRSDDSFLQININHYNKEVSLVHGYMGRGKALAKSLVINIVNN